MQALAVVLFPMMLMLFALSMERVEARLSRLNVREQEVQEFLDQARGDDVAALAVEGFPNALARLRLRNRKRPAPRTPAMPAGLVTDEDRRAS